MAPIQGIAPVSPLSQNERLSIPVHKQTIGSPLSKSLLPPSMEGREQDVLKGIEDLQQKNQEVENQAKEQKIQSLEEKARALGQHRGSIEREIQSPLALPSLLPEPEVPSAARRAYLSGEGKNALRQVVAGLSNLAMIFGGMGSPLAALNALSGSMEGWREGDLNRIQRDFTQYEKQVQKVRNQNAEAIQAWDHARIARSDDRKLQEALLQTRLLEADLPVQAAQVGQMGMDRSLHIWEMAERSLDRIINQENRILRTQIQAEKDRRHMESLNIHDQLALAKAGVDIPEMQGTGGVYPVAGNERTAHSASEQNKMAQQKSRAIQDRLNLMKVEANSQHLTDEAVEGLARRVLSGDTSALTNVGRGIQGSSDLRRIQNKVYELAKKQGLTPEDIAGNVSTFQALKSGERSLSNREANTSSALFEAKALIPLMKDISNKIPRSSWPLINEAIRYGSLNVPFDVQTSAAWKQFDIAINSFIPVYVRALKGTGVPDVTSAEHARSLLSSTLSKQQFDAAIEQLMKEMEAALSSPEKARKMMIEGFVKKNAGTESKGGSPAPATAAKPKASIDDLLRKYGK